jgi:Putative phage abortive infection protein
MMKDITNPNLKKYPNSKKLLNRGLIIFFIATIVVIFMPLIVTKNSLISLGIDKPNEIGDTIGGILGPCVGLIAAGLTFLAFWAQYDANIEQRKQFDQSIQNEKIANEEVKVRILKEQEDQLSEFKARQEQFESNQKLQQQQILLQDKRARINLFETRFYTMLSIHRNNSNSIEINELKGGKVFLQLLEELKFIYFVFEIYMATEEKEVNIKDEELYNISYLSFFFGIGEKSTPIVKDLVSDSLKTLVGKMHNFIEEKKKSGDYENFSVIKIGSKEFIWKNNYSLGTGHLRRLSHYVRHLFQIVKFVDDQPNDLISPEEKYNYVSNLRAQLPAHEQILLHYNSLSVLGNPWLNTSKSRDENYIERYCMLKSIPLNAVDFYKSPTEYLPIHNKLGKAMFEWTEIKERMNEL